MIQLHINHQNLAVAVSGHTDENQVCGAVTALMRVYGILAVEFASQPGRSALVMDPRDQLDFESLTCGLLCIAKAYPEEFALEVIDAEYVETL